MDLSKFMLNKDQNRFILFGLLVFLSLAITYLIVTVGIVISPVVLMIVFGIPSGLLIMYDYKYGVYFTLLFGYFMFMPQRILPVAIPVGVIYDTLIITTFFSMMIASSREGKKGWSAFNNPLSYILAVYVFYKVLQVFNPNAVSIGAYLVSLRAMAALLLYVVCVKMFKTYRVIANFIKVWLFVALLAGVYGLIQEVFGLMPFERAWVYADEVRVGLYVNWGHMRKFSFMSDPTSFGMFMGFAGMFCLALTTGDFKKEIKAILVVSALIMFYSSVFTGTRTAFAIIALGLVFYIALTINQKSTAIVAVFSALAFAVIMFGPFYGGSIQRIRSTFEPSTDASMNVRDVKRRRFQPYIKSHPIGGGEMTVGRSGMRYSPGHYLSGNFETDSGYLRTALETGYIGLTIQMVFYFVILYLGIDGFIRARNSKYKAILLAIVLSFFSLSVAHFTQEAMTQKPVNLIIIAGYAMIIKLRELDRLNE